MACVAISDLGSPDLGHELLRLHRLELDVGVSLSDGEGVVDELELCWRAAHGG